MKTATECLAEAERLDVLARGSTDPQIRLDYDRTADGWRKTALLARQQEVWAEAHPEQA